MADSSIVSLQNNTSAARIQANASKFVGSFNQRPVPVSKLGEIDKYSSYTSYVFPVDDLKYYLTIDISNYQRDSFTSIGNLIPSKSIRLPMPLQLIDTHGVDYDQVAVGALAGVGMEAMAGIKNGKNLSTQVGNLAGEAAAKAVDSALGLFGTASTSGANAFKAFVGYSPNQFLTIVLRGPKYKTYNLSWKLSARNGAESRLLKNIINFLNNSMAPTLSSAGLWLKFPKIMQVAFFPSSQYLFKFKPAVLTDVTYNYSAGGVPAFYRAGPETEGQNAPESIELQLTFLELEFWLNGDYTDNNNPIDVRLGRKTDNGLQDIINKITPGKTPAPDNQPRDRNGIPLISMF